MARYLDDMIHNMALTESMKIKKKHTDVVIVNMPSLIVIEENGELTNLMKWSLEDINKEMNLELRVAIRDEAYNKLRAKGKNVKKIRLAYIVYNRKNNRYYGIRSLKREDIQKAWEKLEAKGIQPLKYKRSRRKEAEIMCS